MVNHVYKDAVNSMCYLILQNIKNEDDYFKEELLLWSESIELTTSPSVLEYIEKCVEIELREGWYYDEYKEAAFEEQMKKYFGEEYEEYLLYHIIKRKILELKTEVH